MMMQMGLLVLLVLVHLGMGLGLVHLGLELLVVNHLICYLQFSILYLSVVTDKCDLGPLNNDGRVIKSCAALFFSF